MSGLPGIERFFICIGLFQPMRRGVGPTGIDGVSKSAHDSGVPGIMKVLRARIRIDLDTVAAVIGIVGRMERLMEIADKMDQEREVAGRAPSVVISVFQSLRVFVDFIGDAVTARASPGDVPSRIAQTNVDEVPRTRRRSFLAKSDESGRTAANSIADAIAFCSTGMPRM